MSGSEATPSRQQSGLRIVVAMVVSPFAGSVCGVAALTLADTAAAWSAGRWENPLEAFRSILSLVDLVTFYCFVGMVIFGIPAIWICHRRRVVSRLAWVLVGTFAALAISLGLLASAGFPFFRDDLMAWLEMLEYLAQLIWPAAVVGAVTGITAWAIVRPDRWPRPRPGA